MVTAEKEQKRVVIVGLGNPGKAYEHTRHNIGFMVVRELALKLGLHFKEGERFKALVAKGKVGEADLHLVLPQTFMNLSGEAVRAYLDYYQLAPKHLIVVSDDIALPFGDMRLRMMGSAGGHNGLKSIEAHIHTRHYVRLRMGIESHERSEKGLADYVLDYFSNEEKHRLEPFIERGTVVLERLLKEEVSCLMNEVNVRRITKPPKEGAGEQA